MRLQDLWQVYLNTHYFVNEGSTFSCRLSQTPWSHSESVFKTRVQTVKEEYKKSASANNYGMINCHHIHWMVRNEKPQAWILVCVTSCWPVVSLVSSRHLRCWRLIAASMTVLQLRAQWLQPVISKCSVSSKTCITSVTQALMTFIMRSMYPPEGS